MKFFIDTANLEEINEFFNFMHLDTPAKRLKDIDDIIKGVSEEYQQIIYKIVHTFEK